MNLDQFFRWAVGYKGLKLQYIDNSTLVYSCGNTLSFVEDTGKHVCSIQSEGQGVGPLEVCSKAGLVAYAEVTLNPNIFILSYPLCQLESTLEGILFASQIYMHLGNYF